MSLVIIALNKLIAKKITYQRSFIKQFSRKMGSRKTIEDFGYAFNNGGQLRKLENGELGDQPFQFNISDNHQECQKHYEDLGEIITEHVYHLLQTEEKLIKVPVPDEEGTFIFVSKDYDKMEKLVVLIHGSGVVRAGQWARSIIINENINAGSQIPYIRKAISQGFGVVILNTNDNYRNNSKIKDNGSPEAHAVYVWEKHILGAKASKIAIVAHSYGGVVTLALANNMKEDFEKRVKAVGFTDSVHSFSTLKLTPHLKQITKNWVASSDPLDKPVLRADDITCISAGHPKHEMTSHSCIDSVFKFIEEKIH